MGKFLSDVPLGRPWKHHATARGHSPHVSLPNMAGVGSMHGSEAKRETDAALPISYEIIAVVQGVVLLCLTMLPEPIMAQMNRKRAGVLGFLFLHENYDQNLHYRILSENCQRQ